MKSLINIQKNNKVKIIEIAIFLFFLILLFGGIFVELEYIKETPSWAPNLFMLVGSLLILLYSNRKLSYLLLSIGLLGFIYEILGVKIGILFGSYNYSEVFNLKLFSVPIVMISAWIIIVNFSLSFIENIKNKAFILYGPLIMVIIDLVIDPIAVIGLEIWIWDEEGPYYGIPNHNFLGWFFLSIPIFILLSISKQNTSLYSRIISNLVISFFSIIGLINELYFPAILGIVLVIFNYLILIKQRKIKRSK
ncbi:carotenoid biosynthesis protein [Chloroflexi bacterium]|nr:carotenoid biosynthesis protein [Chloroflexota bacterium]